MSNVVFTPPPGLSWNVNRRPRWSTVTKKSVSGREFRAAQYSYPVWEYKMSFEVLRARSALPEMQALAAFFNARQGSYDTFLYIDPDDNAVTQQSLGVADGVGIQYQLLRAFGGYVEPVLDVYAWNVFTSCFGGIVSFNYAPWSQDLSNAAWTKVNCSATANAALDPTGVTSGASVLTRSATGNHYAFQTVGFTANANKTFTFSVWLKLGTLTGQVALRLRDGAGASDIASAFHTVTGSWARYTVTGTFGASPAANVQIYIDPANDAGAAGDTLQVWGAQLELGSTASSGTFINSSSAYSWTLGNNGVITFSYPPPAGAALTWTGNFYWRCRFMQDAADFNQFMRQLWELKTLEFTTVKA